MSQVDTSVQSLIEQSQASKIYLFIEGNRFVTISTKMTEINVIEFKLKCDIR